MPYHLSGTISVVQPMTPEFRRALDTHICLTRAEPGCLSFSVVETQPGIFQVDESFIDEDAFTAHQARTQGTAWANLTQDAERHYKTWED